MIKPKFCKNCGEPLVEGAKFCGNCGMPVQEDASDEDNYTQTDDESESNFEVRQETEPETEHDEEQQETDVGTGDNVEFESSGMKVDDEENDEKTEDKSIKNPRPFIIAGCIALIAIIGVIGFAVGRNMNTSDDDQDMVAEVPAEDESASLEEELIEKVAQMSENEIQQSAMDLYDLIVTDAVTDPDELSDLYVNATEESIQADQEYFSSFELSGDEKQLVTIVAEEPLSVGVQIEVYDSGDEFQDISDDFIMTYTESGWKKDLSDEVAEEVYSPENMEEVYPEAYAQALNADRNVYEFDSCFLYLDDAAVFEENFIANLAFLSQDEYDGLTAYVWLGNGTGEDVSINEISLTVTDDSLGDVLDQTVSRDETISSGRSKLVQLHFDDASDVLTGTEEWTEMGAVVSAEDKKETVEQAESKQSESKQAESKSAQSGSSSSGTVEIQGYPDLYAEYDYDIDAYRKDLEKKYSDLSLSTSVLFEDSGLVCIGLRFYNDGEERKAVIGVPKTTAGTSKTLDDFKCSKCSGNGIISKTGTQTETCPICNGTGEMYIPNAVYDVTLNAWVGQYMTCSGCAGEGSVEYTTEYYDWCDKCNGYGVSK